MRIKRLWLFKTEETNTGPPPTESYGIINQDLAEKKKPKRTVMIIVPRSRTTLTSRYTKISRT